MKSDKPVVFALIDADKGEVRPAVIRDVTGATLAKAIGEQVDLPSTTLVTDEWKGYKPLATELADHQTVNHSRDEYPQPAGLHDQPRRGLLRPAQAVNRRHAPQGQP